MYAAGIAVALVQDTVNIYSFGIASAAMGSTSPVSAIQMVTQPQLTFTFTDTSTSTGQLVAGWNNSDGAADRYLKITKTGSTVVETVLDGQTLSYTVQATPVERRELHRPVAASGPRRHRDGFQNKTQLKDRRRTCPLFYFEDRIAQFTTPELRPGQPALEGEYTFVVREDGQPVFKEQPLAGRQPGDTTYIRHSQLAQGGAVWAAGGIYFSNGMVIVTDATGHYHVKLLYLAYASAMLAMLGYNPHDVRLIHFRKFTDQNAKNVAGRNDT
ncbi:MAG TPA: hypothetical protein VFF39_14660 [Verrucomicrobiae bacterium]|nr:hypothetical protein [Verrucomicrobiae bacterium]